MSAGTAISPAALPVGIQFHPVSQLPVEPSLSQRIRNHGFCTFLVKDNSLLPWIRRGDLVFIRRSEFGGVKAGDFILFEQGSRVELRRVVRRSIRPEHGNRIRLLVRGQKRRQKLEDVTGSQFLGYAIRIHRRRRHIDMHSFERATLSKAIVGISFLGDYCRQSLQALRAILFT
jgi:hypothetical protein